MKTITINALDIFAIVLVTLSVTNVIDWAWWEVMLALLLFWAAPSLLMALWFFVLIFLCLVITLGSEE